MDSIGEPKTFHIGGKWRSHPAKNQPRGVPNKRRRSREPGRSLPTSSLAPSRVGGAIRIEFGSLATASHTLSSLRGLDASDVWTLQLSVADRASVARRHIETEDTGTRTLGSVPVESLRPLAGGHLRHLALLLRGSHSSVAGSLGSRTAPSSATHRVLAGLPLTTGGHQPAALYRSLLQREGERTPTDSTGPAGRRFATDQPHAGTERLSPACIVHYCLTIDSAWHINGL